MTLIYNNQAGISLDSDTLLKIYQSVTNTEQPKLIPQSVYNPPRSRRISILSD